MVTIVLLGRLADLGGAPALKLAGPLDWPGLLAALPEALAEAAREPAIKIAHNGALIVDKASLTADQGDEIALLPPVSGG